MRPANLLRGGCIGWIALLATGCACNADDREQTEAPSAETDPGRVALRRLNRTEYNNTVRDLLGTTLRPADSFPYDDTSYGFDNMADTLSVSPLHVELYEQAAASLAAEAVYLPLAEPLYALVEAESEDAIATTGGLSGDAWNLWSNGELYVTLDLPEDGTYELSARLWATQAGLDLARASLSVDSVVLGTFDVAADSRNNAEVHAFEAELAAGAHTVAVSFLNDFYEPDLGLDRNLLVDWIAVYGPTDAQPGANPIRERLFTCEPSGEADRGCARQILEPFAYRAWRRPLAAGELDRILGVFEAVVADEGTFDDGIRLALQYVLLSPNFLYRVELDPDPESPEPRPLTDFELATRLSYFLWSSTPDDALLQAAEEGLLQDPEEIEAQVHRMLADPRADALTTNFAAQWLYIRALPDAFPDPWTYPEFDEALRSSFQEEMTRFFRSFVEEDRDMRELLTTTEGEINARLAEHYDLPPVSDWTRVDLSGVHRGGLFGQGGIHLVTSYPTRTSPVRRGKWVLGQLLCSEPPPPPPGVEGLIDDDASAQTLREQLEQHRKDPSCASCHQTMDNLGFPFEHFDGVGAWRERDRGHPVDGSGILPDGRSFYGTREMAAIIADDPLFSACIVEKVFTFALGRAPVPQDRDTLAHIDTRFREGGLRFRDLAVQIATSPAFRMRRGEP